MSSITTLGRPIAFDRPEPTQEAAPGAPTFEWRLSDEAKRDIEAIETNARSGDAVVTGAFFR